MLPQSPLFYIGKVFDPSVSQTLDQKVQYDPADLTTHAVVTGMTGSGKTGMCIALLEEAALHGIPAIIVDPKGDLTNLLLHFPELRPADFEPWIDPDQAARSGKTLGALAEETAARWRDGLAGCGLGRDALLALQSAGRYTIYTPGSAAGEPVNILSSFQPPPIPWQENRELLREKIASTVTAVLGLIGLDNIDPLRSREHILLANIIEEAWSNTRPLDLTELIMQVQNPPFERLGAFPLDHFYPQKERSDLAMLLNNFLAAPSFETWQEGQSLDIQAMLTGSDGRPRQCIFYLAHLDDNERMFFTTLLFAAVEAWMRTQRGTSGLRAILYFDEISGYLPPVNNPPSKPILLRMIKQGRAFGLGLLLATQNPVDLDYKALSNAGTWFIGRLQTEQDKQRLLDGLLSAGGGLDVPAYDKMISGLQKRVFLWHSANRPAPQLFQTRWTLNYLAGPLTRAQIPQLKLLANPPVMPGVQPSTSPDASHTAAIPGLEIPGPSRVTVPREPAPSESMPSVAARQPGTLSEANVSLYSSTRPPLPASLADYFIPAELGISQAAEAMNISLAAALEAEGVLYRPAMLVQAAVRYLSTRYNFEYQRQVAALVTDLRGSILAWEDYTWRAYQAAHLQSQPLPRARFVPLPGWMADPRKLNAMQKDFLDWVYRTGTLRLHANLALKVFAGPPTTPAEFVQECSQQAQANFQAEVEKINAAYGQKIAAVRQKIAREKAEEKQAKEEVGQRKAEATTASGEFFLGLFGKRKRSLTTSMTKRRLAAQAKADLEAVRQELATLQDQAQALELVRQSLIQEAQERWAKMVTDTSEVPLVPQKKDIFLELYGVAWLPHYLVKVGEEMQEIPAFSLASLQNQT